MLKIADKKVSRQILQDANSPSRITIQQIAFSISAIVVQFYKYASRLMDTITVRITFSDYGVLITRTAEYVPTSDQHFISLFQIIEKDIHGSLRHLHQLKHITIKVEWLNVPSKDEESGACYCLINATRDNDFRTIRFRSGPDVLFHIPFKNAEKHFMNIQKSIHQNPTVAIKTIECFTQEELEEIQSIAYGTPSNVTANGLHSLFEKTAEQYADQIAVQYKNEFISYGQLNGKANLVAHALIKMGIQPGDFVGVLLDRTVEAYIAIIAILKAGAAYVPLDRDFPAERIRFILEDSSAVALISSGNVSDCYESYRGRILHINDIIQNKSLFDYLSHASVNNPSIEVNANSPAYVIYTSGSTGTPKGVIISHAAVTNLVLAEREIFNLYSSDRVLQGFSLAFDASIEEIWLAFSRGATLFPAGKSLMCSGEDLSDFIDCEKITVVSTVPTLLSTMRPSLPSVRLLILGGEAAPQELLQRWHRTDLRIVNTYGPTESTVIATCAEFHPSEKITIGKPIQNYAVFVVNETLTPVPKGVPGELCIAGKGLATGYLNKEALTREKFILPPFKISNDFDQRIYRTGDLAMFNDQGEVEFLGRIDSQVKLRGYRIELSEIESRLLQFNNIKNAVVGVKEDDFQVEQLIAYVSLRDPSIHFDELECKIFLRTSLPDYMIPSLFMEVQNFPVLSSGKIDRKKLPALEKLFRSDRLMVSPRNDRERQIHSVWKKYFHSRDVSVTDHFFLDLGGHSLLAAKMISELRQISGFSQVSILNVYQHPTIEQLARCVQSHSNFKKEPAVHEQEKSQSHYFPSRFKHFCCGLLQFLSLYFVFGFSTLMGATGYVVYFFLSWNGYSWLLSAIGALSSIVVVYPLIIFGAIGVKWILLGQIKPGRYKLWSWFYFRWWLVQNLIRVIGLHHFGGTPLLPWLYRLLGVKIGKDVHLATDHLSAFDVVSIGDGSSIDHDARLSGYSVRNGYLYIDTIQVGKRCFVGERSVLLEGTQMENDARLENLSLLPCGSIIPSGETWEGSPAKFKHAMTPLESPLELRGWKRVGITLLYVALIFVIPIISFISFIPGIAMLFQFDALETPLTYLAILPIVGGSFVLLLIFQTVVIKWMLVGKVKEGKYPVHGSFYIRNWIVEHLLKLSLDYAGQLHATLHVAHWYRALGMKIGRFVELSTAITSVPDLINLSDESTIADEVSLGSPHVERGCMVVNHVKLGRRSFVGNSGMVPSGREMGEGSLVGVLSIAPTAAEANRPNSTWFGSPSILFPNRERSDTFKEEDTYRPSRWLRIKRGTFELLRVTLPPTGFILVTVTMISFALTQWEQIGLLFTLLLLPLVFAASSVVVILMVALIKWVVVGRYKPFVKPLWSNFVWRLELVNALYEFLSAPLLLQSLEGTPFLPWYLRLVGANIGSMCYIETTGFLEWDLIEIGDRCCIGDEAVMQTHLFEDRILKASNFKVGNDCSVGAASVVLYDTSMHNKSQLDALSLLMKGEILQQGTHWIGIPAITKS